MKNAVCKVAHLLQDRARFSDTSWQIHRTWARNGDPLPLSPPPSRSAAAQPTTSITTTEPQLRSNRSDQNGIYDTITVSTSSIIIIMILYYYLSAYIFTGSYKITDYLIFTVRVFTRQQYVSQIISYKKLNWDLCNNNNKENCLCHTKVRYLAFELNNFDQF